MQAFWNEKFQTPNMIYGEAPNNFIKENTDLLSHAKNVMCLGEGEGRNAIYLADLGLNVEALDASDIALFKLRQNAKEHYVGVKVRHTFVEYWEPESLYDAVVCTYLQLPKYAQPLLFEKAIKALRPEGIFIAELFSESQIHFNSGGPKNSALLYDINDIVDCVKHLPCKALKLSQEVILLNEGERHVGRASVIRIILKKLAEN
jgi:SAM-dependent methyltransferase